jgi:hypothetical protein
MNDFEFLFYISYMYMREHHKEDILVRGATSNGKIPFPLMKKGRDLLDAEDRGMVPGGAMVT